jgi:hypothetical protein
MFGKRLIKSNDEGGGVSDGQYIQTTNSFSIDSGSSFSSSPILNGNSCISKDGSTVYRIVIGSNTLYKSIDYGVTFSLVQTFANMQVGFDVAMSENLQYVTVVGVNGGSLYNSNDYGVSFTERLTSRRFLTISVSSSGQYQIASDDSSGLYVSSNYGVSWTNTQSLPFYNGAATNATGQYMVAGNSNYGIYVSSNYGVSWVQRFVSTRMKKPDVNGNGQYMFCGNSGDDYIYVSSNYGVSWAQTGPRLNGWDKTSCSYSGQTVIVGSAFNNPHLSYDYGITWTSAIGIYRERNNYISRLP